MFDYLSELLRRNRKSTSNGSAKNRDSRKTSPRRLRSEQLEERALLSAMSQWASGVIAYSSQYSSTSWSAQQAVGAPNTTTYGDRATAWAPKNKDGTTEYISLRYATPVYATGVSVRETYGNGFVTKIDVRDANTGTFKTVWSGKDATTRNQPAYINATFPQTSYPVDGVRIWVNTNHSSSWEEIDAVKLIGNTSSSTTNKAPVVSAGSNATVTLDGSVSLNGTVTDDGVPNSTCSVSWSKVSGPGTVTFAKSTATDTTAKFSAAGTYVLRLKASDGQLTSSDDTTITVQNSVAKTAGVWISRAELMALPTSGSAWNYLVQQANKTTSTPKLSNPDDQTDVLTLAKALVGVRTNNQTLINQARNNVMAAIGTEKGGESIAIARNLTPYVVAAELVGLDSTQSTKFRSWLKTATSTTVYADGRTLRQMHEERPNNWGTMAGGTRAAVAAYLGDTAELARVAQVFKGWLGDRSSYSGFNFGGPEDDLSWQVNQSSPVAILPKGTMRDGRSLDGAMPEEMRRGSSYSSSKWPPAYTGYVWEALQGAFTQAEVLYRAGYPSYQWQDQALLRSVKFLYSLGKLDSQWLPTGDDSWQPWLINARYGTSYSASATAQPGKIMGWTQWTHGSTASAQLATTQLTAASALAAPEPTSVDAVFAPLASAEMDTSEPHTTLTDQDAYLEATIARATQPAHSKASHRAADRLFAQLRLLQSRDQDSEGKKAGGLLDEYDDLIQVKGDDLLLPPIGPTVL